MGFLTITRKIIYLDPINVLKTDINMGILVDLSHQPAFYHIWMPRYNFLGARGGRDKWSGLEADFRKMVHEPTRPPNKNLLPRDSLIRINRQNPVKKNVGRDFCQRLD